MIIYFFRLKRGRNEKPAARRFLTARSPDWRIPKTRTLSERTKSRRRSPSTKTRTTQKTRKTSKRRRMKMTKKVKRRRKMTKLKNDN